MQIVKTQAIFKCNTNSRNYYYMANINESEKFNKKSLLHT